METATQVAPQEVETFEEYTIYSLEQSVSGVLQMMERSKQVANHWPTVPALVEAADLCKEVAALACFQNSVGEALGEMDGAPGESWEQARRDLQRVMDMLSDTVTFNDEQMAVSLFGSILPASLHTFAASIPVMTSYIRDNYRREDAVALEESEVARR